ncbi:MAG: response regulator [Aquabacterium sp.]|nr:response regulator [Aquabacterium sp.]
MTKLTDAQGRHTGFCKIVRDGTAGHEQGIALLRAKDDAEQANRAKDRFLAVLSHELRTPLMPIASAAHILQNAVEVPDKFKNLLPMIQRNVALEARVIDDLLDVTVITQGKLVLKKAWVDMHSLLLAVVEMLADQVRDKGVVLSVELAEGQATVWADEARIQQVLWNVIRNAIKFTPAGSEVKVRTSVSQGVFQMTCADKGIGIEEDALSRIFQAFEQADEDISKRFGGLGLGLAIARGLVAEHNGLISAYSAGRGKGATFTVSLPCVDAEEDARTDKGVKAKVPTPALRPERSPGATNGVRKLPRILLVEDNPDAATALSLSLQVHDYEVTTVHSCADALRQVQSSQFDLVVTDLGLPDGSGIDIGKALRGTTPVIALSGYGFEQDLKQSDEAGFAAHLVKPVDVDAIHTIMQKVLAQARQ